MRKILTVIASFGIMLCLGGVYAWSIFVPELKSLYSFTAYQSQLVFGVLIAVFPVTMILAGQLEKKLNPRALTVISALFFSTGYILAGISGGNFYIILFGIGLMAGIGTGFGYLAALTTPVKWFPQRKGLVTGIAAAGFGLAAVLLSTIAEGLLRADWNILRVFTMIGLIYGFSILIFSIFIKAPPGPVKSQQISIRQLGGMPYFYKLIAGIFAGTFAGLLIIGNLRPIGEEYLLSSNTLALGISIFAIANFSGRLSWGFLSDFINPSLCISIALAFQAVSIFLIGYIDLTPSTYLIYSGMIGFGFGSNFVLFAKKTSESFGVENLGKVYPYIFLGYAFAGIAGPITGGIIFDIFNNYDIAIYIAVFMSLAGAAIFFTVNGKKSGRMESGLTKVA
jgi:MFS transporter, OFA family, oxalate/formate antiporter